MDPYFCLSAGNMQYVFMNVVFFSPNEPAIDTDNSIIQIHTGLPIKLTFYTEVYIYYSIYQPNRIYQDILLFRIPYAGNARDHGNKFQWRGIPDVRKKLMNKIKHGYKPKKCKM